MTMLDAVEILQTSTARLNYPSNAQMVAMLSNGSQLTGNAVMQSSALGWRQADIVFYLDLNDDVDLVRAAYESHAEVIYVDPWGDTHSVRILTFLPTAAGNALWECTATIVETEAFFSYS